MGVLATKLQCRMCGFKGLVQTRTSADLSSPVGFTFVGQDEDNNLAYRCPSCGQHSSYSLEDIKGRFYRTKLVLLYVMLAFGMAIMVFRVIHTTFLSP
jgi:DNA-directed RNA polymerase subunit RPC12/RpoP